jgi:prepilin-type N-terminal cleavage/methylation domain-containing protein
MNRRNPSQEENRPASSGFTLPEVIVSVTVMSIMIGSLLSYVHFAGMVWIKTHQHITLSSEANVLLDALERELSQAKAVTYPLPGNDDESLRYVKEVSDYNAGGEIDIGYAEFRVALDSDNRRLIHRIHASPSTTGAVPSALTWNASDATDLQQRTLDTDFYNYDLARHITGFRATRSSTNMIDISIIMEGTIDMSDATRTVRLSRSILMPSF